MKLSIITINLNNKVGLQKTIDSIVSQTFTDYEWIVIDGGSTDGSKELIEQYADHIAYYVSEPDNGVYNAMNKGIVKAKGEYINFMNSGDCFATETILSEIFNSQHDADILYGMMMRKTIDGVSNNNSMMKPRLNCFDFYFCTLNHQSTFTKRILFDEVGLFDESYKILADWYFFARAIVMMKATYEYLPLKISIYEGGGISENTENWKLDLLRLRQEIYPNSMVRDSFVVFAEYNEYILPYKLSKFCYRVLRKIMKIYVNTFKKKKEHIFF